LAAKAAGDKSVDDLQWRALTKAGVGLQKWLANDDATTNDQREWHRQAAAAMAPSISSPAVAHTPLPILPASTICLTGV
jgi:hypothetical protein